VALKSGDAMPDLPALIQAKNAAFAALENADRHLDRRQHSHQRGNADPVPEAWLERRAELAAAYDAARAALSLARDGGGGSNAP
jgi:hypothetical protein